MDSIGRCGAFLGKFSNLTCDDGESGAFTRELTLAALNGHSDGDDSDSADEIETTSEEEQALAIGPLDLLHLSTSPTSGEPTTTPAGRVPEMPVADYEVVIGLEVHTHLKTRSKLFSPAPVRYGEEPNHSVHPVCLALPGVLPVLNRRAVDYGHANGILVGAGSDAHVPGAIGASYMVMPDFDGPRSFLDALAEGRIVGHHYDKPRPWTPRIVPSVDDPIASSGSG